MDTFPTVSLLALLQWIGSTVGSEGPNILFVYVDDVGFNDFGFNGNTETQTPFIDNLVQQESLLIEHNYVSFVCSPTRAQMLSGRYASHLGLQHLVFTENAPYSLTRQVSLLSDELNANGYDTYLIGKWHLGFQSWEYTPTYRGFQQFYGFYNGEEEYFSHQASVKDTDLVYYDLRQNEEPDPDTTQYSVYIQRDRFLSIIDSLTATDMETSTDSPFFIYLAFQAAHFPPQAPNEYASLYCNPAADVDSDMDSNSANVKNTNGIKPPQGYTEELSDGDEYLSGDCTAHDMHMAQMTSIDDAMQVIVARLKQDTALWDNTLIVFSSDNGGEMFGGDNAPLRGGKTTPFEGGVRVPAFVSGGYLNDERRGQVLNEFAVHVTDWYRTLCSAANLPVNFERSKKLHASHEEDEDDHLDDKWDYIDEYDIQIPIDGEDIWPAIQNAIIDDRLLNREILLHLDEIECPYDSCGALLYANWKYLRGPNICDAYKCGWNNAWMTQPDDNVLACSMQNADDDTITYLVNREKNSVDDGKDDSIDWSAYSCTDGCLFDLSTDPCEMLNVADEYPEIVQMMQDKLTVWQQNSVQPLMGEDVVYLEPDEIRPTLVCDSEYWCPYMDYDDVQFEQVLLSEYMRLYGPQQEHRVRDNAQSVSEMSVFGTMNQALLLTVIGLFAVFGLASIAYVWLSQRRDGEMMDVYKEASPLLH